jgi:hypothetical protein
MSQQAKQLTEEEKVLKAKQKEERRLAFVSIVK